MGLLDNNLFGLSRNKKFINNQTYSLDSVGTIVTLTPNIRYKAVVIVVNSISSGAEISFYNSSPNGFPVFYNEYGEILTRITKAGRYYINLSGESSGILRNEVAVTSGTCVVSAYYIEDIPDSIITLRPVQLIGQATVPLDTLSLITVFNNIIISNFKYYFISYIIRNGSSSVTRVIQVLAQPYHPYQYQVNNEPGLAENIVDGQDTYAFQSDWQKVRGNGLRLYVKELADSVTEGDTMYINIYGVR